MTEYRARPTELALRRALHLYWRFARGMTLGVRGIVIDGDQRVLLVKHGYVAGWHFPGGGVEPGETIRQSLERELLEESNIVVAGTPMLHGVFFNGAISDRDHIACFVVSEFRQDAPRLPDYEIVDHGFFGRDELPPDVTPGTRRRIAEVFEGARIAERW